MTVRFAERGGYWAVAQCALMLAVLLAGPISSAELRWPATPWAALPLFLLGAVFGVGGVKVLGRNRTIFPKPCDGSELIQGGVYAWVRHPLYLAVALLSAGWAWLWSSGPALAAAALLTVFLDCKARREERWLIEKFPHYAAYQRRVKRLIPWVY